MKTGSPPTAPKARAGLLTPPGMDRQARWKASRLRARVGGMAASLRGLVRRHGAGLLELRRQLRVLLLRVEVEHLLDQHPGLRRVHVLDGLGIPDAPLDLLLAGYVRLLGEV